MLLSAGPQLAAILNLDYVVGASFPGYTRSSETTSWYLCSSHPTAVKPGWKHPFVMEMSSGREGVVKNYTSTRLQPLANSPYALVGQTMSKRQICCFCWPTWVHTRDFSQGATACMMSGSHKTSFPLALKTLLEHASQVSVACHTNCLRER